jgi:hypothetical protein
MESNPKTLCNRFAQILGGTATFSSNMCVVVVTRDIPAKIMERPSPTAASGFFAFNSLDENGMALNLGEFVLLEKEVNPFVNALREQQIKVTAIKAHWLFDKPHLIYINFQSIDKPLSFARKVHHAFRVLI